MNKQVKRRLNRPSQASFRVPSYLVRDLQFDGRPLLCSGYRTLSVTLDSTGLFFHGIIWTVNEDGDEDMCYSQVTAYDPMVIWRYRPARDDVDSYSGDAGNFSDPSFLERNLYGPQIMEEILIASEGLTDPLRIPEFAEGPLRLDLSTSTFAQGTADLSGAPTNWPMTIAEIASLLTNTGELDIVIEPIIGLGIPSNLGRVHCFNGNYGNDLTGSVHFDYATGDYNARLLRRTEDMSTIANKNWYYLGPRQDQQHWAANVTGDRPSLPHPPGGDVTLPYTNGAPGSPTNPLGGVIASSRNELGVFMQIGIYDNFGSEASAFPLYERLWQVESLLRANPRNMVYITPIRNGAFGPGDFDVGDLVTINIGDAARVSESGAQRIYAYTIDIDDDAVEALGEFESSPDQDTI